MGNARSARVGLLAAGIVAGLTLGVTSLAPPAQAVTKVYTATKTIPVPPSSAYAGGGGGDGWDLSMTPRAVYNVFHHQGSLRVACHLQSTAQPCAPSVGPRTITDVEGAGFGTGNHSGTHLDPATGRLFVYASSRGDGSGGVVCVDTTLADDVPNPFCGYDRLTAEGDDLGEYELSAPIRVGTRWFAVDYTQGTTTTARILCFDLQTQNACAGQPFSLPGLDGLDYPGFPPIPTAVGGRLMVPYRLGAGGAALGCFDPSTLTTCAGAWPSTIDGGHINQNGSLIPVLTAAGGTEGVCPPNGAAADCRTMQGAPLTPPPGLLTTIVGTSPYNGQPVTIGDRVYMANGNVDQVQCFDYGSGTSCPNFPRSTNLGAQGSAGYIYTVNPDPQRPECLWVNADYGSAQIQNFDAFTAGACGSGALRVLASSIVQSAPECVPDVYTRLAVLAPARDGYASGTVGFLDSDGQAIEGVEDRVIGPDGAVDLSDLNLTSESGLPQFLISLQQTGETDLSAVTLELTWTGDADADCTPTTTVSVDPQHGLVGDSFTLGYSCPSDPSVAITRPDGSPVEPAGSVSLGAQQSQDGLAYTRTVSIGAEGSFVATVLCGINEARSTVFTTVPPVEGTLGVGWPQVPGGVDLVWSYGGGELFRSNAVAGTTSWNDAVDGVGFTEWTGDATPVNVSFADVNLPDDTYALTFFPDGADASYRRIFVYLNPVRLTGEAVSVRTKVVTHELGHVLGLPDEDPSSPRVTIMKHGPQPFSDPQAYDIARVNERY